MKHELMKYKLEYLSEQRRSKAIKAGGKILGHFLPPGTDDGGGVEDLLTQSTFYLDSFAPGLSKVFDRVLTLPQFLITRKKGFTLRYGNTELVQDAARYDLVELLIKLQSGLMNTDIELVDPKISITDARYNYDWRGTIFDFHLGDITTARNRGMQPHYVGYSPDADFDPRKTSNNKHAPGSIEKISVNQVYSMKEGQYTPTEK